MTTSNDYVTILNTKRILHMPSCLIVEMMTRLYSQVSRISLVDDPHFAVPDLTVMLHRLTQNLKTTSAALLMGRIKFFIGDWRDDKLRARKLFFNLMSRLGYIAQLLGHGERDRLYRAVEDISSAWAELDTIMEKKSAEKHGHCHIDTCIFFRSEHPAIWQQSMANSILLLHADADYSEPETYLILLCYKRIRTALLRTIDVIERKHCVAKKFSPERILCVSNEDFPISCPTCSLMTESLREGTNEVVHKGCDRAGEKKKSRGRGIRPVVLGGRYPMPPSLAGLSRR